MLAAIAVPEQLATAKLAGFPPEAGLFAFIAGSIAFAVFGSNPYMSVGADSTVAPIFAGTLTLLVASQTSHYVPLASFLALLTGLVLVIAGLTRSGWIADLLSVPVTVGFLAGISVHIVAGQLPALLGVAAGSGSLIERVWRVVQHAGESNAGDLSIGLGVLAVTLLASALNKQIPGALIGLVLAAVASFALGLQRHGVAMVGALSASFPSPELPQVHGFDEIAGLAPLVLIVTAVCMMQTAAVGRSFPARDGASENVSGDFLAVGVGSVLASLLGAFPVDSSPPRTAIVKSSGGRSQLAAVTAAVAAGGVIFFASRLLSYVPEAALAGVLVYVAMHIFRLNDMIRIAKYSRREFLLMSAGALFVVILPIQTGMLLAIVLSLAHGIQLMMRPPATELLRVPGTTIWWPAADQTGGERIPGVVVFAPAAPINFTNAQFIRERLLAAAANRTPPAYLVVIEASGVTDFDYTGSQSLQAAIARLREGGAEVAMARLIVTHAQQAAAQSGLVETLGPANIFKTVEEAVDTIKPRVTSY
jgi:MFS superfamily sulfate permease-like transporter